jgi:hypothetical protein
MKKQKSEFSPSDLTTLKRCERVIKQGRKQFLAVGKALATIREKRLYRIKGFNTFEDYCQKKWNITRQYANRLVLAFRVQQDLETTVSKPVLENPNQAKRFKDLDPEAQSAVKQSIANGASFEDAIRQVGDKPSEITTARRYATKLCQLLDTAQDKQAMIDAIQNLIEEISDYIRLKAEREQRMAEDAEFDKAAA